MKFSTIRLIVVLAAVVILGIWALAGCGSSSSTTSLPPSSQGILGGHTTAPPASSVTSSCVLGWFNSASGNTFTPGAAPSTSDPGGFGATLTNDTSSPVQVSWINVSVFFHGRQVGSQTLQNDTADTIAPHAADNSWSTMFTPDEAEAKVPLRIMNATNGNIEDKPAFTCKVSQWGNAT